MTKPPRVIDAEELKRARGIPERPGTAVYIPTVWSTGPKSVGIDPTAVHLEADGSLALGGGGESIAAATAEGMADEPRDWSGLPMPTVEQGYYRHADGELVHVAMPGYEKEPAGAWAYRVAYRVVVKTRGGWRPVGPVFTRTVEDFRARFKAEP